MARRFDDAGLIRTSANSSSSTMLLISRTRFRWSLDAVEEPIGRARPLELGAEGVRFRCQGRHPAPPPRICRAARTVRTLAGLTSA